jgi:hypothetical protein
MRIKTTLRQLIPAIILLGGVVTGTVSCQKDKKENPSPATGSGDLKEYKNGEDFIRFTYNADGSVKKATVKNDLVTDGNTLDYNVSYNAQKKISSVQTSAGERIEPVYENGVMVRADIFEGTERTGYTNYQYGNGKLITATLYWGSGNDFNPFFEFIFSYDNNGNLSRTVAMMATQVLGQLTRIGHIDFQYDNKSNPLFAHNDLLALFWQTASKNNIVQEDHFDLNLVQEDKYVYTYTYKANGKPEHASVKQGLPGQPQTTSEIEYVY